MNFLCKKARKERTRMKAHSKPEMKYLRKTTQIHYNNDIKAEIILDLIIILLHLRNLNGGKVEIASRFYKKKITICY